MYLQDHGRVIPDRAFVIGNLRAIGSADLAERGSRARQNFGYAKLTSDLDEFASGDHNFTSCCERGQDKISGRRAVVYDECVFGARKLAEHRFDACASMTAFSRGKIVFDGAVTCGLEKCVPRLI